MAAGRRQEAGAGGAHTPHSTLHTPAPSTIIFQIRPVQHSRTAHSSSESTVQEIVRSKRTIEHVLRGFLFRLPAVQSVGLYVYLSKYGVGS